MIVLEGTGVCGGVAVGQIYYFKHGGWTVERREVEDPEEEIYRFLRAKRDADSQLADLYERALSLVGRSDAQIVKIQRALLEDPEYSGVIIDLIEKESVCAEFAVDHICANYVRMFDALEDPYLQDRAADVRDISQRLVGILTGAPVQKDARLASAESVIVAADDLVPSETIQLGRDKILAFVTRRGSKTSHTAILASTMGIPAVVSVGGELSSQMDGLFAAVDGSDGLVYIEPDVKQLRALREKQWHERHRQDLLQHLRGMPSITRDGRRVRILANIGGVADIDAALHADAEGVGLFRSEFLFLERSACPTEEEQFNAYSTVARRMDGKGVVIRTLDIGADKRADYLEMPRETNPALGCRGVRLCLKRPEIFKAQLRAIYRAGACGKVSILLPMISSVAEVTEVRRFAAEVCAGLEASGEAYSKDMRIGVMIETPAAAVISDLLAQNADFFSIGTNDLAQYTLAVDRENGANGAAPNEHHPAVLRLIEMTVKNAHAKGIPVCVCGEMAGDLALAPTFLSMGVDELSVAPARVLALRQAVRRI